MPPGHPKFGKIVPCDNPCHADERVRRLAVVSGLHPADLKRRLVDIYPMPGNKTMLDAARQMIDDPCGWLYIHGGPGNAKSEILIAMVNEINAAGKGPAMYVKFTGLVNYIREAFAERSYRQKQLERGVGAGGWDNLGYLDRFNRVKDIKFLAIDELDKARVTEFVEEFRFDFLDERYRQAINGDTVTVFASQTPPGELPKPLASRVMDGRFIVVCNTAGDARPEMD